MLKRLFAFSAVALPLLGADLSGIWTGQLTDKNGDSHDIAFQLIQKGDAIAGKMYGDNESTPISEGNISGQQITFTTKSEMNGQHTTFVFGGNIDAGEIHVTRKRVEVRDVPAAKDPAKKPDPDPVIVLKRLT
ncbi:MAG: hypothetical protein M3Y07_15620 [Acidobacteriota bacterium]|nr:hypothetical protein [Acidobacteriota bacterium]